MKEEDVVEYALTYGIKKAGKTFHISDATVKDVLRLFIKDNSIPLRCHCEEAYDKHGSVFMCWMCNLSPTQKDGLSLSLRERLLKAGYYN